MLNKLRSAWATLLMLSLLIVSDASLAQRTVPPNLSSRPAIQKATGGEIIDVRDIDGTPKVARLSDLLGDIAVIPNRRLPHYITDLGDSRVTADFLDGVQRNRGASSPLNWANALSGQRFLIGPTFGVSGDRTDHFFARLSAAIATGAGTLRIQGGVNDIAQTSGSSTFVHAVTGATISSANVGTQAATNIISMAEAARAAGMIVIIEAEVGTNSFDATQTANVMTENALLFAYAEKTPGVFIHDARAAVMQAAYSDTASQFRTGYTNDGVHMQSRGAYYWGKSLAPVLNSVSSALRFGTTLVNRYQLPANGRWQLESNPIFQTASGGTLGTGATGTAPGSTVVNCAGSATVAASVTADAGGLGNNLTLAPTFTAANDSCRAIQDVAIGNWSPGDIVEGVAEVQVTNTTALLGVQLELSINGTDVNAVQVGMNLQDMAVGSSQLGPDETYTVTLRTRTVQVSPAMTTKAFMSLAVRTVGAAAGTSGVKILRMSVNRKTALPY